MLLTLLEREQEINCGNRQQGEIGVFPLSFTINRIYQLDQCRLKTHAVSLRRYYYSNLSP